MGVSIVAGAILWLNAAVSIAALSLPQLFFPDRHAAVAIEPRQVKGGNCTDRSLALKTLTIFNATFQTNDRTGSESSSIVFRVGNSLTGANERCAANGPQVSYDPDVWYNCDHLADPTAPRSSFRYGSVDNVLEVQGTWICNDKDPAKPLSLDAFAHGSIPWVCTTPAEGRYAKVCTQEKEYEITVEMSARSADG